MLGWFRRLLLRWKSRKYDPAQHDDSSSSAPATSAVVFWSRTCHGITHASGQRRPLQGEAMTYILLIPAFVLGFLVGAWWVNRRILQVLDSLPKIGKS